MNIAWLQRVVSGSQRGLLASLTRAILKGLTPLYRFGINRRNRQFDDGSREVIDVLAKVISIGNLTTGGTGKTPAVIWVCELLQEIGARTAIVSRGYGTKANAPNDEAMELSQRLPDIPHVQNPDRVAASEQCLAEHGSEVIVLDDAFQHRRIARDLDIVLVDALNPFGYGHLLPRGLLREPIESLGRADVVVITRCEQVGEQADSLKQQIRQHTSAPIALARTEPVALAEKGGRLTEVSQLRSGNWFVFSAIGNPAAFEASLEALGCKVVGSIRFRDHHCFDESDHLRIAQQANQHGADFLLCTHKDLVKLDPTAFRIPLLALQTRLKVFAGEDALRARIIAAIQ